MPPSSASSLGRQAVLFSVILLVSGGLCGYTVARDPDAILLGLGSGAGIVIGVIGLLVTGIQALIRSGSSTPSPPPPRP